MSVVAHQYNILSEQLRRGIGGLNQAKLQNSRAELEMEQLKYGIEKDRRAEARADAESVRADTRLAMAEKEHKVGLPAKQLKAMQAAEQMKIDRNDMKTDMTKQHLYQLAGIQPGMITPGTEAMFDKELAEIAGVTYDQNGMVRKNGKKVDMYSGKRDSDISGAFAFADWEVFTNDVKGQLQEQIANTTDPAQRSEMYKSLAALQKKEQKRETNRPQYETRRTDVMLRAYGAMKDPDMREAAMAKIKVQMQREKAAIELSGSSGKYREVKVYRGREQVLSMMVPKNQSVSNQMVQEKFQDPGLTLNQADKTTLESMTVSELHKMKTQGMQYEPDEVGVMLLDRMQDSISERDLMKMAWLDDIAKINRLGKGTDSYRAAKNLSYRRKILTKGFRNRKEMDEAAKWIKGNKATKDLTAEEIQMLKDMNEIRVERGW